LLRDIRTVTGGKYSYSSKFESGVFSFALGAGASITGFDEGISKMKLGDKAILVFPSSLGYKEKGSGNIPPYSPLQFEVEVTGVK
jgi:FKBP-type peptidyl-prolyl cis-trans isomerase